MVQNEPMSMTNVTKLPSENSMGDGQGDGQKEQRRRLHLRDIANDAPADGDSVGAMLRAARLARGDELQAIADTLRIRRTHLEALEEGNADGLPGRPYAIGFIRSYGEYLGLDVAMIVERYKSELGETEGEDPLGIGEVPEDSGFPKASLAVLGLLLAVGIYGVWLLSVSTDRQLADRVPPVPDRLGAQLSTAPSPMVTGENQQSVAEEEASQGADVAAAATVPPTVPPTVPVDRTPAGAAAEAGSGPNAASGLAAGPSGNRAAVPVEVTVATLAPPASTASMPPASEAEASAPVQPAPTDTSAALEAVSEPAAQLVSSVALPPLPEGRIYGALDGEVRVMIRAREADAWIRIEDSAANVLIEETLSPGDIYRAPDREGLILVARDAGALEVLVDGRSLGLVGKKGLVLTSKSLNADDLVADGRAP